MDANLHKISAVVIITGSLFFLIAAFSPVSRVFGEPSAVKKLEIIMGSRNLWTFSQIFFAAGALVTVAGIGLSMVSLRGQSLSIIMYACMALLLAGAILWTWHVYLRAVDPAAFTERTIPVWLFVTYTIFTQTGLILYGMMLLQTWLPEWVGWMLIGSMAFFFILTIIFRDMPPFVYYAITLTAGIIIYRADSLTGT